ncbi:hypothetical protein [Novosphingobium sediminicola]|uniref:Uncharacterized protein n=1 Tax=Novosphingobium sediminicola TaxID=563162 RepID=A0A7W6G4L4_9SPHN|nr:hypothetical protein [Novosphingobium sediminicola]MBB3953353.1 hypothetical protein [Novosphingobium sediminicola]
MKAYLAACAMMAAALSPGVAMADDPHDPAMRSAAARARDKAEIARLNRNQLAYVRKRDAGYAKDWAAYREAQGQGQGQGRSDYEETSYESGYGARRDAADYAQSRRDYERDLAEWRYAAGQCRAGNYAYCAR